MTIGSVSAILVLIGALLAVDFFLAKTDQAEVRQEATHFYSEGSRLLREGKAAEAEEMLRRAHALARGNRQYQLQLVAALLATAKSREAENLLQDLLRKEPNDGRANLLAARLAVQAGRTADAESYYHRAIYGVWHEKPAAHRMEVRLELIDLLAARHAEKELLAELLPLEAEAPDDRAMRQRIASLYLVAGSPARSERAFRALIQDDPINAEAYAGLGEAELALGNYPGAQAAFRAALVRNPGDHATRQRLELARNLTELDPTPRRLSSSEKYRRSITILQRAADALERCTTQSQGSASEDSAQLLAAAAKALTKRPRGVITNELSEEKLSLGEQLWRARAKLCPAAPSEEVLSLIMDKLSQ
ncbi:MAG: tetratricopeptide repeat protein [Acidobacteria bacterium]|nr:tetratricopeptide repeat protein [Acidobacteriota bacterium]